jgi:hypothetical protein
VTLIRPQGPVRELRDLAKVDLARELVLEVEAMVAARK